MSLDSKKIAKNTMFMYFRMILVMAVSMYTSRVVLDKLGVEDFGLYNAITSVVGIVGFVTNTLNTTTSRFLTFELGRGRMDKMVSMFSTISIIYVIFSLVMVVLLETAGLYYLSHVFVTPPGREEAAGIVYQISILLVVLSFLEVPFSSAIVANEDLNIYAYIGIADVIIKLLIVYLLAISPVDKLVTYALLMLGAKLLISTAYVLSSYLKYNYVRLKRVFDKSIFKEVMSFTSWTLVANVSNAITVQGSILLINLFFAPAIIAAKALATQVSNALMLFVNNFRTAVNPQIIKSYSAGYVGSHRKLILASTNLYYDMLLILGLPFVFTMKTVLEVWLVEVPPYAVEFTQLVIITQLVSLIDNSFYTTFVAAGKLKVLSFIGLASSVLYFIILYFIYKLGGDVLWAQYLLLISNCIWSFLIKPWLMVKDLDYKVSELWHCLKGCILVLVISFATSWGVSLLFGDSLLQQALLFVVVLLICIIYSIVFMDKELRNKIINLLKRK